MQRIRFGMRLDGERGWHPRSALGESTVGPLGLLSILETQLGLTRLVPSTAERIVQMRGCLKSACTGDRFYEKSFEVDELGIAAEILAWRDCWYEQGCHGSVPKDSVPRLLDIAAIDALGVSNIFPGIGQRLNDIAALLALRQPQIASIEIVVDFAAPSSSGRRSKRSRAGVRGSSAVHRGGSELCRPIDTIPSRHPDSNSETGDRMLVTIFRCRKGGQNRHDLLIDHPVVCFSHSRLIVKVGSSNS